MIEFLAMMAAPIARCEVPAWSIDRDPTGLRVRAGPSRAAREIARLYSVRRDGDREDTEFDIVEVRGEWVRIANARNFGMAQDGHIAFRGTGWVHRSRIAFTVQSETGRAAPRVGAPVVVRADGWLTDAGGRQQPIVACAGGWARLRYRLPVDMKALHGPRSGLAWFGGICGNQHTSCDGMDERRSPTAE